MNKKLFKFIPAALAVVALASCSADDLWNSGTSDSEIGKKSLVVNLGEIETDEGSMRSSMTPTSNAREFNAGDQVRVYDNLLQAYDLYTFSGDSRRFTINEGESDVTDPEYMLFPSNMVEYGSWKKGEGLYALMRLAAYDYDEFDQTTFVDGVLYYGEDDKLVEGETAYLSNVPEFGVVEVDEGGLKTKNQASSVFLTGVLKIRVDDGINHVSKIRVRSLDENGDPNKKMPLWGYFDAVLDDSDMNTNNNLSKLAVSDDKLAATLENSGKDLTTLTVDLANLSEAYTSYVYIPIVPTTTKAENGPDVTYPKLAVEWLPVGGNENNDWVEITTFKDKQIKTNTVYSQGAPDEDGKTAPMVIGGLAINITANTLMEINKALARYAPVAGEGGLTINVTLSSDIFIEKPENYNQADEDKYLMVPELTNDIVLNLNYENSNKTIGGSYSDNRDLVIKDKAGVGEGKLTINLGSYVYCESKVVSESAHAIELATAANSTVNGLEVKNADADFTMNCDLKNANSELTLTAAKLVTLKKDPKHAIVVEDIDIVVDCDLQYDSETTITTKAGNVTVNGLKRVSTMITTESGNVTAIENARAARITTTTGTVTIDYLEADNTLSSPTSLIIMKGKATLNLDNGFVKEIQNEATDETGTVGTEVTIVSKGKSAIGKVTYPDKATITSYWDGEYYGGFDSSTGAYNDYAANSGSSSAVYTATQLANLRSGRNANLYANIYLNEEADGENLWNGLTRTRHFYGNNHTIYNVVLNVEEGAQGFFNKVTADVAVNISNLTIDGLKAEGKLETAGALVGNVRTDAGNDCTISGVTIKGASLNGDGTSNNVGGLIGNVNGGGKLTVKGTSVDAIVEGYYNLGVVFGSISEYATVELGDADNNVSVAKTSFINVTKEFATTTKSDNNAGKVGIVVGELNGKLNLAKFSSGLASGDIDTDAWRYDLCRINVLVTGEDVNQTYDLYFKGGYGPTKGVRQYFVGYSPNAKEYKKGTVVQTSCYNGETEYTAPAEKKAVYNVFE